MGQDDLVIADIKTSWLLPTFSGKVIGAMHAQSFVNDQIQRKVDLEVFFEPTSNVKERQYILNKYKPKFLLLDKLGIKDWSVLSEQFNRAGQGRTIYENSHYELIRLTDH